MSYDLWFWRQTKPLTLSLDEVCEELSLENEIDGIEMLPINRIKECLLSEFPDIDDQLSSMTWEGDGSYFDVTWPANRSHVSVSCGYKLLENPDSLNRIIELMSKFGCALYDPQTGERYEQREPDDAA